MTSRFRQLLSRRVVTHLALAMMAAWAISACGEEEGLGSASGQQGPRATAWPSFHMTYAIRSGSEAHEIQIWDLAYEDEWTWSKTLVENSVDPSLVGVTEEFHDGTFTVTQPVVEDPKTGENWTFSEDLGETPAAPDFWLLKDRDLLYTDRGYLDDAASVHDILVFVMRGVAPCDESLSPIPEQQSACRTSDTYRTTEETRYTTLVNPPLPVSFVMTIEDRVVTSIEVVALTVADESIRLPGS
jgi:hypothetical protein